jgi:hypothetical protein
MKFYQFTIFCFYLSAVNPFINIHVCIQLRTNEK